jgi:flagellar biosynthesis protein FlhG
MNDQAERLRWLAHSLKEKVDSEISGKTSSPRIIAVTSGKGGVGKTNLSLNLALAIIEFNRSVLLVDADMGTANIDVVIGMIPKYSLYHVIQGTKLITDIIMEGPKGLRIIPGASGICDMANLPPERIEQLLEDLKDLEKMAEIIIIDTGAGVSDSVIKFILAADEVMVVTTPEPTSLTDAYALIKIIAKENPEVVIRLVINRVDNEAEGIMVANKLKMAASRFLNIDTEFYGYILNDNAVTKAVRKQQPFLLAYPKAPATTCIYRLAAQVCKNGKHKTLESSGFFKKLLQLFKD